MKNIKTYNNFLNEAKKHHNQYDDNYPADIHDSPKDLENSFGVDDANLVIKVVLGSDNILYVYKFMPRKGIPYIIGFENATQKDFFKVLDKIKAFYKDWTPIFYNDKHNEHYFKLFYKDTDFKEYK